MLLEKVVLLAPAAFAAEAAAADVQVRLAARGARGEWRLKLWNALGRDPQPLPTWELGDAPAVRDIGQAHKLDGCTLTWTARIAARPGGRFELRLEVLQNGAKLPGADFFYAGPLDDLEERSGRFHFKQAARR